MKYLMKVFAYLCCVIWMCQAQNRLACNREPLTWVQAQEACIVAMGVPASPSNSVIEEQVWSPEYIYLGEAVYGDLDYPEEFVCYYVDYSKPRGPKIGRVSCLERYHYFCEGWTGWYTAEPATWSEAVEDCPKFWDGSDSFSIQGIPRQRVWIRRAKRLMLATFSERHDSSPWSCIQTSTSGKYSKVSCNIRLKSLCQFPSNTALPAGFHATCNVVTDTTTEAPTTVTSEDVTTTVRITTTPPPPPTTGAFMYNNTTEPPNTTTEEVTITTVTMDEMNKPVDPVPSNLVLMISLILVGVLVSSAAGMTCFCWKRRRLTKNVPGTINADGTDTRAPVKGVQDTDKETAYSSVNMDQEKESAYNYCCEKADYYTSVSIQKHNVEKENDYDVTNIHKTVMTEASENVYNKLNIKNNTDDSGIFNDDSSSIYNVTMKVGPGNPNDSTYSTLSRQCRGFEEEELHVYGRTPSFYHEDETYGNLPNKNDESPYDHTTTNRNLFTPDNLYGNISTA